MLSVNHLWMPPGWVPILLDHNKGYEVAIPGGLLSLVVRLQKETSVGSWGYLPRGLGSSTRGLPSWVSLCHLVSLSVRQGGGEEGQASGRWPLGSVP